MSDDFPSLQYIPPSEPEPEPAPLIVDPSEIAVCDRLATLHLELDALLIEHRQDNGETLGHLFMADVCRWFEDKYRADDRHATSALAECLEEEYATATPAVENVIAASFLENLPWPPDPDAEALAALLGPRLRQALTEMQEWETIAHTDSGDIPEH